MSELQTNDTMPKMGHVTDLREQWLVRADGQLAHRLQDREISSHLCENRYRNQQIREDFPVALSEQRDIEHEAQLKELTRLRQAEIDAEIAREMAEINLRRQRRRQSADLLHQPGSSRALPPQPYSDTVHAMPAAISDEIDLEELGLSSVELEEMRRRLEQEEKDARLARELSTQVQGQDALLADMRYAVEAQDSELARLLQEREYKKLQRAKEKARIKKQQRLAAQKLQLQTQTNNLQTATTLCDAYSNPRDMIRETGMRLCKSVDSDLNYVEPFEKETIQSKASALHLKEMSRQHFAVQPEASTSRNESDRFHNPTKQSDVEISQQLSFPHRHPPPPPLIGKKPRFPDPVSIRPASHYATDASFEVAETLSNTVSVPHSYSDDNHLYSTAFPVENSQNFPNNSYDRPDKSKRLSVISDITPEALAKKKNKQAEMQKKKKGCKIQ